MATPVLLLLHVPPVITSVKVALLPRQTFDGPDIGDGNGFTVTEYVLLQPVYIINSIVAGPSDMPVTVPDASTVAINGEPQAHVPPTVIDDKLIVLPAHNVVGPVIGAGNAPTVNIAVA